MSSHILKRIVLPDVQKCVAQFVLRCQQSYLYDPAVLSEEVEVAKNFNSGNRGSVVEVVVFQSNSELLVKHTKMLKSTTYIRSQQPHQFLLCPQTFQIPRLKIIFYHGNWLPFHQNVRAFHLSITTNKSHYDTLEVTPHATHGDIKSAYYKLSLKFHPDKNKGSEVAAKRFLEISAAYEVLGNFKLRKMYDKGVLRTDGSQYQEAESSDADVENATFYKSKVQRSKPPPPSGRTPIYDFDEWSRAHYGQAFARRERAKAKWHSKTERQVSDMGDMRMEATVFLMLVVVLLIFFTGQTRKNYDTDQTSDKLKIDGSKKS